MLRQFAARSGSALRTVRPVVCSPRSALATAVESPPEKRAGAGLKEFLKEKTGVTGAGTLAFGLGALAISKELIILHAETLVAGSMGIVIYFLVKRVGGDVGQYLDQYAQDIHDTFSSSRNEAISKLAASVQQEEALEGMLECRKEVFEVLKENNALLLEEEYRKRQLLVDSEVRRRLDYQLALEHTQRQLEQDHLVEWLESRVTRDMKDRADEALPPCFTEIERLAAKA